MQIFIDFEDTYTLEELNEIREKQMDYVEANDED